MKHVTLEKGEGDNVKVTWKGKVYIKGFIPGFGTYEARNDANQSYTGPDKTGYGLFSGPNGVPDMFDTLLKGGAKIVWGGR